MRLNNETKIGLLAIICIGGLIWGYNFLKGRNLLKAADTYYVSYQNVDFLTESSPVLLNGAEVGVVSSLTPQKDLLKGWIVEFIIEEEVDLPPNTIAEIVDQGVMGSKSIVLNLTEPCNSAFPCPEKENHLRGLDQSFISSILGPPKEINLYLRALSNNVGMLIDSLEEELRADPDARGLNRSMYDISETLRNLNSMTANLDRFLTASTSSFISMSKNLEKITDNIQQNNEDVSRLISSSADFSEQLAGLPLDSTLQQTEGAIQSLQSVMESTQQTVGELNDLLSQVNAGEGSLGKLLTDEQLYEQFTTLSIHLDTLVQDFQERPYRYMPLKNRKRVKRYDRKDAQEE